MLGLGGVVTFDYSEDPRKARLVGNDDDYVTFDGEQDGHRTTACWFGTADGQTAASCVGLSE